MSDGTSIRQQRGCHGVAEHMRIHPFADPCPLSIVVKAFPCALGSEAGGVFPLRDEKCRMVIMPDLQILLKPLIRFPLGSYT